MIPTTFVLYNANAPSGRNYGMESDLALDAGAAASSWAPRWGC